MKAIRNIIIFLLVILTIVGYYFAFTYLINYQNDRYCGLISFHNQEEYNKFYWELVLNDDIKIIDDLRVKNKSTPIIASLDIRTEQEISFLPRYEITEGHYVVYIIITFFLLGGIFALLLIALVSIWEELGWDY